MTMTVYADDVNTTTNNSNTTSSVDSVDRIFNAKPNKPLQQYLQETRGLLF